MENDASTKEVNKGVMEYDEEDIAKFEKDTTDKLAEIKKLDTMSRYFTTVYLWVYYLVMILIAVILITLVSKFPNSMWKDYAITAVAGVGLITGAYYGCKKFRIKHNSIKVKKLTWWKKALIIISSLLLCFIVVIYLGIADSYKDSELLMKQFQQYQQEQEQNTTPSYSNSEDYDKAVAAGEQI